MWISATDLCSKCDFNAMWTHLHGSSKYHFISLVYHLSLYNFITYYLEPQMCLKLDTSRRFKCNEQMTVWQRSVMESRMRIFILVLLFTVCLHILYVYTFSIIPNIGFIMRTYHITNAKYIHNAAPKFNLISVSYITPSLDFYSICKMKTYRELKVMLRLHSQKWEFELFPALLVPQTLHRWVGPQICNVTN